MVRIDKDFEKKMCHSLGVDPVVYSKLSPSDTPRLGMGAVHVFFFRYIDGLFHSYFWDHLLTGISLLFLTHLVGVS